MNGAFWINVARALLVAAITATAAILWRLNERVAILDERVSSVLQHSDRQDAEFERKLQRIEELLQRK